MRPSTSLQSIYTFKCVTSAFAITFHTPTIPTTFSIVTHHFCNYISHTYNSPTLSKVIPTTTFINYFINYLYMHFNYFLVNNIFYFKEQGEKMKDQLKKKNWQSDWWKWIIQLWQTNNENCTIKKSSTFRRLNM